MEFHEPSASDSENNIIHVAVFGPGYGESIVIKAPSLGWGVIDSCLHRIKGRNLNPALEYLKSHGVKKLSFLILTHPHKDHFQGFDLIIDHFLGRIDRICYYSGTGLREYRMYLAKKQTLREPGLVELASIFKKIKEAKENGANIVKLSERTEILRPKKYGENFLEMVALSPSEESVGKYIEVLFDAIPTKDGEYIYAVDDSSHNLISSAVYLKIDNVSLIFGSDLENGINEFTGWRGVLNNIDSPDLSTNYVKVPHHGSDGAFFKPIWEEFGKSNKIISVITPYNRLTNPLPRVEVIERIKEFSQKIAITSRVRTTRPAKIYNQRITQNLHGAKSWRYLVKPRQAGCVIATLSTIDGSLVDLKLTKPAYIYPKD